MNINERGKGDRRFFAIASVGRARWYWVVWPSLRELQTSKTPLSHIVEGYEKTKVEAVEKAFDAAGIYAKWIAAKYAQAYHQKTRARKTGKGKSPHVAESPNTLAMHEFLYREVFD